MLISFEAQGQNLLTNGNFESPGGGFRSFLGPQDTFLTGWSVTAPSVTYYDRHNDATGEGSHVVQLGYFFSAGGLQQSFATDLNGIYAVSFYLASDPFNGSLPGRARVTVGNIDQIFTAAGVSGQLTVPWQRYEFQFQATSASTTLRFEPTYQIQGSSMPLLDSVSVVSVPEPGYTLLICLACSIVLYRSRVAKQL